MKKMLSAALVAALAAGTAIAAQPPAEAWQIGPVIKGRNYSVGMPPVMARGPQGATFAFPAQGQGHMHYATLDTGPLARARMVTVRYRIDAAPGTRFVAQEDGSPGIFGIAFQRAGDTWSAKGRYNFYRWYSPQTVRLSPGVHTFTARLDDPRWTPVMGGYVEGNEGAFADALANAESLSLTFGGASGRGHGVFATAPARFTLLDFRID